MSGENFLTEKQNFKLNHYGLEVHSGLVDALNDLKEVRQTNAPSIYDERLLDSTGVYDPDLLDKGRCDWWTVSTNKGR